MPLVQPVHKALGEVTAYCKCWLAQGFSSLLKTLAAVIDNLLPGERNFYEKKMA